MLSSVPQLTKQDLESFRDPVPDSNTGIVLYVELNPLRSDHDRPGKLRQCQNCIYVLDLTQFASLKNLALYQNIRPMSEPDTVVVSGGKLTDSA